jgi:hypothetical protein
VVRRPSPRTLVRTIAALGVLAAFVVAGPVLWLEIDEGAVPAASDAPPVPAGVTIADDEVRCGSGGCWRELTLTGLDGRSRAELEESMDLAQERCGARNLIDRRRLCIGLDGADDEVVLYLRFDRLLSL